MRGLYVHLPFCKKKCPYCGFYSSVSFEERTVSKYLETCLREMEETENKNFDTIYLGGGTPSALPPRLLEKFISELLKKINFSGMEFSIEANPESVDTNFLKIIENSPVTRVSLGVQSFDDRTLELLGRIHNGKTALTAARSLLNLSVDVNLDMIFDILGVPEKTIFQTAKEILDLSPSHVSAYSYSSVDAGYLKGFNEDESVFEKIEDFFARNGFAKYETSNFAKPGKESEHNKIYWTGDEYIGVGAAAHSMIYNKGHRLRYSRPADVKTYMEDFRQTEIRELLDNETSFKESVTVGLRMTKGANLADIEKRFGNIDENLLKNINKYVDLGLLIWDFPYLRTSKRGAAVLDSLSLYLWEG